MSIFTYPEVPANTANQATKCNGSAPTPVPYMAPAAGATWTNPVWTSSTPTYQITSGGTNGYMSDWSSNNQTVGSNGSYNTTSGLAIAAGGVTGCGGMQAKGGEGTYLAGAIYAAGESLAAQALAVPNSKNAMIILSDGDATAKSSQFDASVKLSKTGVYPDRMMSVTSRLQRQTGFPITCRTQQFSQSPTTRERAEPVRPILRLSPHALSCSKWLPCHLISMPTPPQAARGRD